MTRIVIAGIDGAIARRSAVELLASAPDRSVVALGHGHGYFDPRVERARADLLKVDLARADLDRTLQSADMLVMVGSALISQYGCTGAVTATKNLIEAIDGVEAGPKYVVVLSSAVVYGAWPHNPVPLTERHPRQPLVGSPYASAFAAMEEAAEWWASGPGRELITLRPAVTLAPGQVDPMAARLRAAATRRPNQVDPPVQFLHGDDLIRALCLVVDSGEVGVFNVAPSGWIDPETFDVLVSEDSIRVPRPVSELNAQLGDLLPASGLAANLEDYVAYPWVVANDRLMSLGWESTYTNEEAYVLGHPAPWWRRMVDGRRQEITLGALSVASAAGLAGLGVLAKGLAARRF